MQLEIYERLHASPHQRIDRERHVIRGVKVVGIRSGNSPRVIGVESPARTYTYSLEALRQAVPLYEGAAVNIDHPDFRFQPGGAREPAQGSRKAGDRFGRLVNVRVAEDGLYADLEYLASHPMAERVIEAAERMPEVFALSHHALTVPAVKPDGSVVIEKIVGVVSVDLIGERPGTTTSLFESAPPPPQAVGASGRWAMHESQLDTEVASDSTSIPGRTSMKQSVRAVVEAAPENTPGRGRVLRMIELAGGERELETVPESGPEGVKAAFRGLVEEVLEQLDTSGSDVPAAIARLQVLLCEEGTSSPESLRQEISRLTARDAARTALESAGVRIRPERIETLLGMSDESRRIDLLENWAGEDQTNGPRVSLPRSRPALESLTPQTPAFEPEQPGRMIQYLRGNG